MEFLSNINVWAIVAFVAFAALESLSLRRVRKQLVPKEHIMLTIAEIIVLIGILFL